jgi:antitoxin component YwqK of YwqJK toxin-antitoxin module
MRSLLFPFVLGLFGCTDAGTSPSKPVAADSTQRMTTEDTLRDGHHTLRDAFGRPTAEGDILGHNRHGVWTSYNEQGRVRSRNEYVHGVLQGPTITFRDNGALFYVGQHRDGKQVGEWKFYDGSGELLRTAQFDSTGREVIAP